MKDLAAELGISERVFQLYINKDILSGLSGEALVDFLWGHPIIRNLFKEKILTCGHKKKGKGMDMEEIYALFPPRFRRKERVDALLQSMIEANRVALRDHAVYVVYPTLEAYVEGTANTLYRTGLMGLLDGKAADKVAQAARISLERVRQIQLTYLQSVHVDEERYKWFWEEYPGLTLADVKDLWALSDRTARYLALVMPQAKDDGQDLDRRDEDLRRVADRAEREEVRLRARTKLAPVRYWSIDGEAVKQTREDLLKYFIRTHARDKVPSYELQGAYDQLLDRLGVKGNPAFAADLQTDEHLARAEYTLCTHTKWIHWNCLRYYDIPGRTYEKLIDGLGLARLADGEYSTLKFFKDNPELMKAYDIRDEYELHNLLEKVWARDWRNAVLDAHHTVDFADMPILRFGQANRYNQAIALIRAHGPIKKWELTRLYEEEYGLRASMFWDSADMKSLAPYYANGVYEVKAAGTEEAPETEADGAGEVPHGEEPPAAAPVTAERDGADEPPKRTDDKAVREQYFTWLAGQVSQAKLSALYMTYADMEKFCVENHIITGTLFALTDIADVDRVKDTITQNQGFRTMYKKQFPLMKLAVLFYARFMKEYLKAGEGAVQDKHAVTAIPVGTDTARAPHPAVGTETTPAAAVSPSERADRGAMKRIDSMQVREQYFAWLAKKVSPSRLSTLYMPYVAIEHFCVEHHIITGTLFTLTDAADVDKVKETVVKDNRFRTTYKRHLSIMLTAVHFYVQFMKEHLKAGRGTIRARTADSAIPVGTSAARAPQPAGPERSPAAAVSPAENLFQRVSEETKTRYTEILSESFGENGYRKRPIPRGRFKAKYEEKYGHAPEESDEEIDAIMSLVGTERDGRIFPRDGKQDQLIEAIIGDILAAFDSGVTAVYVEAVFDKYRKPLAEELHVYSEDALEAVLLDHAHGRYAKRYKYLTNRGAGASPRNDLIRVMKTFHEPQTYDAIHKKAWYIPYKKLKNRLTTTDSIVYVAGETYFYAPNLPVSAEELARLSHALNEELSYRSYITESRLMELIKEKCPGLAINTEEYTSYGLRNCLGYLLRDQLTVNGPVITARGRALNAADVFSEFAKGHEVLSLNELEELSEGIGTGIYWHAVLTEMIRVSADKLVRKDRVHFDVDATDEVLERLCPGEYIPLKEANLFLQFPPMGYPWNSFVLESYVYSCSRKFRLVNVSFSKSGAYGAIVRRDAPIEDYRALLVDALSKSNALTSPKEALQYIVDKGYQNSRRYDGIDGVLREARARKTMREKGK